MTEELRAEMEALRTIAPRLNKATDEASLVIMAANDFLNSLGLGISSRSSPFFKRSLLSNDSEISDIEAERIAMGSLFTLSGLLAYDRVRDGFSIHVVTVKEESPSGGDDEDWRILEEEVFHWSSCPRETKLKAVTALPNLLGCIASRATFLAQAADMASTKVREIMTAMGHPVEDLDTRKMDVPLKYRKAVSFPKDVDSPEVTANGDLVSQGLPNPPGPPRGRRSGKSSR